MSRRSAELARTFLLLPLLLASAAWAQEGGDAQHCIGAAGGQGAYDLPQLLEVAQCLNPETHEAWEHARQAAFAVDLVRSSYSPQVSFEALGGFQRTPLPIPTKLMPRGYFVSNTREFIPMIGVKWLLFDFGRRAGMESSARATQAAADVAYDGARQKLVFEVTRAYFGLLADQGKLHAADEAVKAAQTIQAATDDQRRHGRATVVAVAQAERQTALSRLNQARARGAVRTAQAGLLAAIGLPADMPLAIREMNEVALPERPREPIAHYLQQALEQRPDVRAAESKVRAAEGGVQQAHSAYRPTVSISARYFQNIGALNSDGGPYYSINRPGGAVFLNVEWALFDGGQRAAKLSIAHSEVAAAQDEVEQARDKVAQDVAKAYSDLETSLEARAEALAFAAAAKTAYDAALDAYRHGVGTYTDLANDEAAMAQAQSSLASAEAEVRIAAVGLELATGTVHVPP